MRRKRPKHPLESPWLIPVLVVPFGVLTFVHGVFLPRFLPGTNLLLLFLALFVVLLVLMGLGTVAYIFFQRAWLRAEDNDFALARRITGLEGAVVRRDEFTLWFRGRQSPEILFAGQYVEARRRFEAFVGTPVELKRVPRILLFGSHFEFRSYYMKRFLDLGSLEALYEPGNPARIALFLDPDGHNLIDPEPRARLMFTYYFIEQAKGFIPSFWLNSGLGSFLTAGSSPTALARAQRRVRLALAKGTLRPQEEVFGVSMRRILKRIRRSHENLDDFKYLDVMSSQFVSLIAYLIGPDSTPQRREGFRNFFLAVQVRDNYESVFREHVGMGFAELFDAWKTWVQTQPVGPPAPPSTPALRRAILEWCIPTLEDDRAPFEETVQVVRDIGRAGYVLGADRLIDLVATSGKELRDTAQWALENISGETHETPAEWRRWWESLPREAESVS